MQKDKQFYEEFFEKHGANVHNDPERFAKVAELLHDSVLDIACGTGNLADHYLGDYFGVDISEKAIEMAREVRRKSAQFEVMDFTKMQIFNGKKFDSFYIGEFLEHIEDDRMIFENILSCSFEGSRVVVSVPNGDRVPDESHCRTFTVPQIRRDYAKYGRVRFHDWSGFKDRILFSIDLGISAPSDVSLVMCVKDEELGLENAIISALGLVERVIVSVDTKSSDKTLELANLYADEVLRHVWVDDFSAMRNAAHKNVKTKWILFLDGHEYIDRIGNVRDMLINESDAISTTIKMETGLTFQYPRIYRNGRTFSEPVHNTLNAKILQYCPKFLIVHDRIGSQSKQAAEMRGVQRKRMILNTMKERLKKNKKDQRAFFYLANFYFTAKEFKKALFFYKKCIKQTPSNEEKYFLELQKGICQQLLHHFLFAQWTFRGLEKLCPNRWETKKMLAINYMMIGRYLLALPLLVGALDGNKRQYFYEPFGFNLSELWDLQAMCYNALGQNAEAVIAWEEAKKASADPKRKDFFQTKANFAKMLVRDINATFSLSNDQVQEMQGSTNKPPAENKQTRS